MGGIIRRLKIFLYRFIVDIDLKPQDKFKKEMERQKRRAIHSSVMMELENEYSGAPEEIKVTNFK